MPTYQYRCESCSQELEAVQKFTDPPLTQCPSCSGELRKVFSAVGVVFKGSGFYSTDSRKKSANTSAPKSETKSETKTDGTKTAPAKSETKSDSGSSAKAPTAA